jgi:polyphosphate kinase
VDRYLEHGRVYIFHNNGNNDVFLGSADWMNRNIYKRIEVCFPVYQDHLKKEILDMIKLQLSDNTQAVLIDKELQNVSVAVDGTMVQSQVEIYKSISDKIRREGA